MYCSTLIKPSDFAQQIMFSDAEDLFKWATPEMVKDSLGISGTMRVEDGKFIFIPEGPMEFRHEIRDAVVPENRDLHDGDAVECKLVTTRGWTILKQDFLAAWWLRDQGTPFVTGKFLLEVD